MKEFLETAAVLIIDDCSSDGTQTLINNLANTHNNIKGFLNNKNQGISYNRNYLIDKAIELGLSPNDYILFVDGDDILPPNSVNIKIKKFNQNPQLECVGGQIDIFYDNSDKIDKFDSFNIDPEYMDIAQLFECHFYISNAMFTGSVFVNKNIRFSNLPTSEDWDFFTRHHINKIHIAETTLLYRRHNNNLTNPNDLIKTDSIRHLIKNNQLSQINVNLTKEESGLLDLIGYISLQFSIENDYDIIDKSNIKLNWFNLLEKNSFFISNKNELISNVEHVFNKIIKHNMLHKKYNQKKLEYFFNTMLNRVQSI